MSIMVWLVLKRASGKGEGEGEKGRRGTRIFGACVPITITSLQDEGMR